LCEKTGFGLQACLGRHATRQIKRIIKKVKKFRVFTDQKAVKIPKSSLLTGFLASFVVTFSVNAHAGLFSWLGFGSKVGPGYSKIVKVIESQPVANARLVYWDQSAADAMGIHTPPGRVGIPDFDQAILKKIAREIKQKAQVISDPKANLDEAGNPYIFVEDDAFGGSGRAGYVEIEPGIWVNIKGVGITSAGRTGNVVPSPPNDTYSSHHDGSATLEESIKETVDGRVADAELPRGGNRVLAIFYTGRTLRYPDGREVPLAEIVRVPMTRYDQGGDKTAVTESLAEANARRIMKGDFVNESNMGYKGEFVDYGTMSFTQGYAPLESSQGAKFLQENKYFGLDDKVYLRALGKGLIEQMGIPEAQLDAIDVNSGAIRDQIEKMGKSFVDSVYWVKGKPGQMAQPTLLDFQNIETEKLLGNVRFDLYFREAAKNFYKADPNSREQVLQSELKRLLSMTGDQDQDLVQKLTQFLSQSQELLEKVAQVNSITDRAHYGDMVAQVANFKNRDIWDLVRPRMFNKAGGLADQFVKDHNAESIGAYIEDTVQGNRFETAPAADNLFVVSADQQVTRIHIRAFEESDRTFKLFQYPDLPGAKPGEQFFFRVSTDAWQTQKDFPALFLKTKVGNYLEIEIPHGSMPVTNAQIEVVPFVKTASGEIHWLKDGFNLRGPPMVFNERVGLPSAFSRKDGYMREKFNQMISIHEKDLMPLEDPLGARCDLLLLHAP
jgi:hypothetical protein